MKFDVFFQMFITDQCTINFLFWIEKKRENGFNCRHISYIFRIIHKYRKTIKVDYVRERGIGIVNFSVSMRFKEKRYWKELNMREKN